MRPGRLLPARRAAAALLLVTGAALAGAASAQVAAPPVASSPAANGGGAALLATIEALTGPGMDGRATGSDGAATARRWIEARLTALGVRPVGAAYASSFAFTSKDGTARSGINLLARCDGRKADAPYLVVSAHYDHLGIRTGRTYHGADDNASGVALLLHVAERCVQTPYAHPLLLAFFDAEEQGLQGAKAFVQAPPVPRARLALDLNFDMVSRSDRREIFVAGPGRWPLLAPLLAPLTHDAPVTVRFGHDTGGGTNDWTSQSDHGAFHDAGIPFVYFGVEDHADYHQPTDTADKIRPEFLGGVATVVMRALDALDRAAAFR